MSERTVVWFSCGAASAVAAKLALGERPSAEIVYCDTATNEHPDNRRFFKDVEHWLGKPITVIRSAKYDSVDAVIADRQYMAGILGAPCTVELKKIPRFDWQRPDDIHVFGYTADEGPRVEKFVHNNPELNLWWVLVERGYSKMRCIREVARAGIRNPAMYALGYRNNNCLGCVKATSIEYWTKVREDFPEVFAKRCEQSRRYGARLTQLDGRRIYLDEIPPTQRQLGLVYENVSCGPECAEVS